MFSLQTRLSMLKALLTKRSPFYIQFYVSKHCHLQCKMCNIVEANHDLAPFDGAMIEKIADNLVKIGAGVVLLTGGEPFLRDDIDRIVAVFKERNLDVRLQTSGLYKRRDVIKRCIAAGATDINVSLDSLDEELSDYINGVPGSWRKALRTIGMISRARGPKKSVNALGCVLSRYNIDHVESVLDFASRIGWWLSLVPVHITTTEHPLNFRGYDPYFAFRPEDHARVAELIARLKERKREGALLFDSDDYLDSIVAFVRDGRPSWRVKGVCDTPNLYFAILPDGRFAPCCDHRVKDVLYAYDDDFVEKFRSQALRDEVRSIARSCPGCNYGSFPEMTLTVRSLSTFVERVRLQRKAAKHTRPTLTEDEIFTVAREVREAHADAYGADSPAQRRRKYWPCASNIPERLSRCGGEGASDLPYGKEDDDA